MADRRMLRLATHRLLFRGGFYFVLTDFMFVMLIATPAFAVVAPPSTSAMPAVLTCTYLPDPLSDATFPCPREQLGVKPVFVNVTLRLRLELNDPDGDLANVTIYFDYLDYLNAAGGPPGSLVKTVDVTQNGTEPATVETDWTYMQLGELIRTENESHYWVGIVAKDLSGVESELYFFELYVNINGPPFVSVPPPNPYPVLPFITFPDPVVPPANLQIVVQDPDDDSLVVTWEWGDGTSTANTTGPASSGANVAASHDYPPELLRLNETPRTARFPLRIFVEDGKGHNTSAGPYSVEFFISPDKPPNPSIFVSPDKTGSLWKLGDNIPLEGYAVDPQGDAIEAYFWDFDDRTNADNVGGLDDDMETLGNLTAHAYSLPGTYTVSLWATDGLDKKVCRDENATTCVDPRSHWQRSQWTVRVRPNGAPIVAVTNQNGSMERGTVLNATLFDPDGDHITVVWSFGDGTSAITNVPGRRPPGEPIEEPYSGTVVSISHDYPRPGEFYEFTVRVTDGEATDEATALIFVSSENLPPGPPLLRLLRGNGMVAGNGTYLPDETVRLEIVLADPENDTLQVRIAWGDGNETVLNVTLPEGVVTGAPGASCEPNALKQTVCFVNHTYAQTGDYTIVLNLTDNRRFVRLNETFVPEDVISHFVPGTITLLVRLPVKVEAAEPWDWWDYSTLSALVGIPLLLLARGLVRSYCERREE